MSTTRVQEEVERRPLLGASPHFQTSPNSTPSRDLYRNFLMMSFFFALNHACIVSCLAYSTTILGNALGGYGSGMLYIAYALTALMLAKPVVSMVGPKLGLVLGLIGYCVYVIGFLLAILIPVLSWPIFLLSAVIGGMSGGLLWPAQGKYFTANAKLYAQSSGLSIEDINSTFAGLFSLSYLGMETLTKLLATLIYLMFPSIAYYLVFTVYTILAVVACVFMLSIDDLQEFGTWELDWKAISKQTVASITIVFQDVRLALLIPFQISFGFTSSFVPYYILGTVVAGSSHLGDTYVGLLSALIVLTGAAVSMPSAEIANYLGKPMVMTIGGLCLLLTGALLFHTTDESLGTWRLIIPYLIIYGIGRATWVSFICYYYYFFVLANFHLICVLFFI